MLNPLPDDKTLDWSKLKQSADNNFEFDVNSKNISKLVENKVFSKGLFPRASKGVIVWEWVKLTHYQTTNFRLFQTERVCR